MLQRRAINPWCCAVCAPSAGQCVRKKNTHTHQRTQQKRHLCTDGTQPQRTITHSRLLYARCVGANTWPMSRRLCPHQYYYVDKSPTHTCLHASTFLLPRRALSSHSLVCDMCLRVWSVTCVCVLFTVHILCIVSRWLAECAPSARGWAVRCVDTAWHCLAGSRVRA